MTYIDLKQEYTGINPYDENISEDDKEYWNETKPEEVLQYHFKCSIELYGYDKDKYDSIWDDDIPCGKLHFIEKGTNKIYDRDFNEVDTKEFKKEFGCKKSDIIKLANDKIDSVEATNYTIDNICCAFIKFSPEDFEFYTIQQDEDIIL